MMDEKELKRLLTAAVRAAALGGREILRVYVTDFKVEHKGDDSPVTEADKAADVVIEKVLSGASEHPILSEERDGVPYVERKDWKYFWLVDPLDGTKEFISRNGEFTVNIALIGENGAPVAGVVYVPIIKAMYFGAKGLGAYKLDCGGECPETYEGLLENAIKLDGKKREGALRVVASRSHLSKETEEYLDGLKKKYGALELTSAGSSMKFCLVAEGRADVYPRLGPTMEWDTAAGHAVADAAGCETLEFNARSPLRYNKENLLNPSFIVKRIGVEA